MTEKEATKVLAVYILQLEHSLAEGECEEYNEKEMAEAKRKDEQTLGALNMAIKALEEIQQYRELGTVEDIRDLLIVISEDSDNANEHGIDLEIIKNLIELKHYRVIGTVEECREAREKQKAKKPIIGADFMVGSDDNGEPIWKHDYICPECGLGIAGEYICCPYCGTYIDWSEEE